MAEEEDPASQSFGITAANACKCLQSLQKPRSFNSKTIIFCSRICTRILENRNDKKSSALQLTVSWHRRGLGCIWTRFGIRRRGLGERGRGLGARGHKRDGTREAVTKTRTAMRHEPDKAQLLNHQQKCQCAIPADALSLPQDGRRPPPLPSGQISSYKLL